MYFAFITNTPLVTVSDLYVLARAIEPCAQACAKAWGRELPAIDVFDDAASLPAFCQPVVFVENDDANSGFQAFHQPDKFHMASARVMAAGASGLLSGAQSISEAASHEVVEALVDPLCDLYTHCPGRASDVLIALEVGDPLQDSYVGVAMAKDVQLTNFAYPAYFDDRYADPAEAQRLLAAGGKLDHLGTLTRAGQIGPEGYAVFKDSTGQAWLENAAGRIAGAMKRGAQHPAARTNRRLAA